MEQIAELKPNVKKLCMLSSIEIMIVSAVTIGFAIWLDSVINFNQLFEIFQEFGAPPAQSSVLLRWLILIAIGLTIIILILNYLTLGKVRYVFYEDKLIYYNNFLIMEISKTEIPYANITKVSVDQPNTIKNADIKLELTGMKKKDIILKFIDNAAKVAAGIQNIINKYRANYYAQYARDYTLQKTAERDY